MRLVWKRLLTRTLGARDSVVMDLKNRGRLEKIFINIFIFVSTLIFSLAHTYAVYVYAVYMGCTCGVHVVYLWCTCGVPVVYMWFTCGVHEVYMWCTCDVHVVYMCCTCGEEKRASVIDKLTDIQTLRPKRVL